MAEATGMRELNKNAKDMPAICRAERAVIAAAKVWADSGSATLTESNIQHVVKQLMDAVAKPRELEAK